LMISSKILKRLFLLLSIVIISLSLAFILIPKQSLFQWGVTAEQKLAGLSNKIISIGDGEISYLEGGSGETLLLLHGFGADKNNWNRLAKELSSKYHIIAVDLPGFGDSFKDISLNYDVAAQVERLNEIVTQLGLSEFHLAGNSMGGYIAGNYGASFPQQIKSLWLLDPLGVSTAPDSEMFQQIQSGKRAMVLPTNKLEYEQLIDFIFYQRPFLPSFMVEQLAELAISNVDINTKIFQDIHHKKNEEVIFSSALDKVLTGFNKPVLITWGEKDRVLHPEGARILAAVIPNVQVHMMDNIGHLPMVEAPSATAQQFINFNQKSL
jgi:abhydrolase domain-containing protein 6